MLLSKWQFFAALLLFLAVTEIAIGLDISFKNKLYHMRSNQTFRDPKRTRNALFGYSIAYGSKSLLVGSPLGSEMGQAFICAIASADSCTRLPVDASIKTKARGRNFWFGARVDAGPGFYMACAPRGVNTISTSSTVLNGTLGQCYYKPTSEVFGVNMKPMSRVPDQMMVDYYMDADLNSEKSFAPELIKFTSFGWSSHVSSHENGHKINKILVGGPAMSIGRAMLFKKPDISPDLIMVDNADLKKLNHEIAFNFGYSITSGDFIESGSTMYAISTPYGSIGRGRIVLLDDIDLESKDSRTVKSNSIFIDNEELGALFGAAFSSMKCERCGADALVVGAPTSVTSQAAGSYDKGAVYVYMLRDSDRGMRPVLVRKLQGYTNGGYFGAAIASVGDLNGDGTDEIVVSAPFENQGQGVVYIYSGDQVLNESHPDPIPWIQRVVPEGPAEQYFGLSLLAVNDDDENGCKELAIGAPGGNYVMLLRCMASVSVFFHVDFPDLKKQGQELSRSDSSFSFDPCLKVVYPKKPRIYNTEIEVTVTIIHKHATIVGATKNGTLTFNPRPNLSTRKPEYCQRLTVNLPKNGDYDQDIQFNVSAVLVKNPLLLTKFDPALVLLNDTTTLSAMFTAPALPGSILRYEMSTTLQEGYMIGSTDNETLTLKIQNSGNTAIGACLRARIRGVAMSNVIGGQKCSRSGEILTCTPTPSLKMGDHWTANVTLSTKLMDSSVDKVLIYAELLRGCTKQIEGLKDYNKTIELKTDQNITVWTPGTHAVNATGKELSSTEGKQIEHTFMIINYGITKWANMRCEVTLSPDIVTRSVLAGDSLCRREGDKAICTIRELRKDVPSYVKVQMELHQGDRVVEKIKNGGEAQLKTQLLLILKTNKTTNVTRSSELTSIITIWEGPKVPVWIIIVASLVGLLILMIIGWIMHECGCLKRKNKEKLQELKKDIRRQSMRRSMRQSTIEATKKDSSNGLSDDRERLVDVSEESDTISQGELKDNRVLVDLDEDPATAAFTKELNRALKKADTKVVTKLDSHDAGSQN